MEGGWLLAPHPESSKVRNPAGLRTMVCCHVPLHGQVDEDLDTVLLNWLCPFHCVGVYCWRDISRAILGGDKHIVRT
jgi:hypothetical protein